MYTMASVGLMLIICQVLTTQIPPSLADIGVRRSGPYKVLIEKLTSCEDQGTGEIVFGTKITKTSDGRYMYNSPIYLGYTIDEDFKVLSELQVFGNGGYRPRYMHHTFRGCEELWKYFGEFYKKMSQAVGVAIDGCPIPKGNYSLKDLEVDMPQLKNFPVMMYNKYKTVIKSFHKSTKVGCINVYVDVVPK